MGDQDGEKLTKQTNSTKTSKPGGATAIVRQTVARLQPLQFQRHRGRCNRQQELISNSWLRHIENRISGLNVQRVDKKVNDVIGNSTASMSRNGNNRDQSASSRGSIRKHFGSQYGDGYPQQQGRGRARGQINHSDNRKHVTACRENGKSRCLGFKYVDNLLKLDEENFVLKISQSMRQLGEFVEGTDLSSDTYVLIIKLLKKIFDSRFPKSQQVLLQTILKEKFVDNLQKYLACLPMHDANQKLQNEFFWTDTNSFWTNLIEVARKALEILPAYTSNILPKVVLALQVCIPSFEQHQKAPVSERIKSELAELVEILEMTRLRFEEGTIAITTHSKTGKKMIFEKDEPPNDFRTISVYPDVSEVLSERSFVRPNVVDGPYRDVDHYLDVQFRLLREDFVNPLRSGVRSIQSGESKRYESVRVHRRIRFLYQETINEYHSIRLKFNFSAKPLDFHYENSKRFMYGTLLCFTPDNFASLKFARVVKRDKGDLIKGELVVSFDTPQPDLRLHHDYMMIECSVFFEPYFNVLTALKTIDEDDLAMKKYIVDVDQVEVSPKYADGHPMYEIDGKDFPTDALTSITDNVYGLNESQMKAFKAALSREFVIIQGPPGTGKTYVALKIAQTLLDNLEMWWNSTPMLVICFTNHALDQFLEGLLETTRDIVRVGGQSRNESLQDFNISKLRSLSSDKQSYSVKHQIQTVLNDLGSVTGKIKMIEHCTGIVSFECFYRTLPDFESVFPRTTDPKFFMRWLMDGYQERYFNRLNNGRNPHIDTYEDMENSYESEKRSENPPVDDDDNVNAYDDVYANAYDNYSSGIFADMVIRPLRSGLTLRELHTRMMQLRTSIEEMQNCEDPYTYSQWDIHNAHRDLFEVGEQHKYLQRRLDEVRTAMCDGHVRPNIDTRNPALLQYDDRWKLYTYWLSCYKKHLQNQAVILTREFRGLHKQYEEVQQLEDTRLLRTKLVVGMTTTSAARLRSVLQGLCSPVVIVEEAAEVLEAHIITALTKHCQHLILIGDHKQLKPSSADYTITKDYKLGISLFERMVNNGIKCHTLDVQHRMRPEMSRLICPTIYPYLKDHTSVFNRPPIAGIDCPIRFIDHRELEDDCGDNHTKKNMHEVKFAVALARHLILNGYESEQITILAAYLGQMFAMTKERDRYGIAKNVRVTALDNYQGEENDIIILSLVRSNTINKIGFLGIENRVCVALSRAKNGFYIIGNMELLSNNSKLWKEIKSTLESQDALGPHLTLRCGVHKDVTTLVSKSEDFQPVSEGGCHQICNGELICGHLCQSLCHIQNRNHEDYRCRERCRKKLCDKDEGHICQKKCYEECGHCTYMVVKKLDCGHEVLLACDDYKCPELVSTKLSCDHVVEKPCHANANTFNCPMPCEVIVDSCGHSCTRKCHVGNDPDHLEYKCMKKCARPRLGCTMEEDSVDHLCPKFCYESCPPCNIPTKKQRTKCSHVDEVSCSEDVDSIPCGKPCMKPLCCGHQCKKKCSEPCEPSACRVKVKKILELCAHEISTFCDMMPSRNLCEKKCPLKLPCGHTCTQRCNQKCTPQCEVLVDCQVEAACGHVIKRMKCHDLTSGLAKNDGKLLANCSEPCNVKLKCGHQCPGTCGACLQGRFHKRCSEKCGAILVCSHECCFSCREACRPCNQKCTYRCQHSVCKKKCGDVCTPCKEPCRRHCQHQRCTRLCSFICDVPPCTEPCSKLLKCGHACIGFCGEPCPPKCLICDREELLETEMLFGYENENSRFVLLADCKHVLESEGMEEWLKKGDDSSAIGVKVCPKCKTPIKTTQRYSDHIKRAIVDVNKVKIKAAGSPKEINETKLDLMRRIHALRDRLKSSIWESHLYGLDRRLKPIRRKRRQYVNIIELRAIAAKLQVLEQIVDIIKDPKEMNFCKEYQQGICDVLERDEDYITNQEIEDITNELGRLLRAIQYERMRRSSEYKYCLTVHAGTKQLSESIVTALCSIGPYLDDAKIKSLLEELKKLVGSKQVLRDVEKREIVAAMRMNRGHWFKCRNGHVYAIGECGGASQISKCNECGAQIGGTGHRLLPDNALAPEMDGAAYPAYSDTANNMRNFWNFM